MAQTESENISKKVIIKTFLEQKLGTIFNQKQILTYIFLNYFFFIGNSAVFTLSPNSNFTIKCRADSKNILLPKVFLDNE